MENFVISINFIEGWVDKAIIWGVIMKSSQKKSELFLAFISSIPLLKWFWQIKEFKERKGEKVLRSLSSFGTTGTWDLVQAQI